MPSLPLDKILRLVLPGISHRTSEVVTIIVACNGNIESAERMAQQVALGSRFRLARLLRQEGLPPLERLVAWIRVLQWAYVAESSEESLYRLALSSDFDPASAYRLVRRITGARWSEVRRIGFAGVLVRFLNECSSQMSMRVSHAGGPRVEEKSDEHRRPSTGG